MDKTTPIQRAILILKKRIELSGSHTYDEITKEHIHILESLLPKEKEFVEKIWNAAISHHEQEERSPGLAGPRNPKPDKFKFLNQLYPEK